MFFNKNCYISFCTLSQCHNVTLSHVIFNLPKSSVVVIGVLRAVATRGGTIAAGTALLLKFGFKYIIESPAYHCQEKSRGNTKSQKCNVMAKIDGQHLSTSFTIVLLCLENTQMENMYLTVVKK